MTETVTVPPPRLAPERPFPAYAYRPGRTPHPTRDAQGHSHGALPESPAAPDPDAWRACPDYLYGIDLFNYGYYWEAHEAWEGLWVACGRRGATARFLQGLINLAAAGFKARAGNARGLRANARTAWAMFDSFAKRAPGTVRYMGLEVAALADFAARNATGSERPAPAGEDGALPFELVLRPA